MNHRGIRGIVVLALLIKFAIGTLVAAPNPVPETPTPVTAKELAQGFREHVILAKPLASRRARIVVDESREGVRVRQAFSRIGDLRVIVLDDADAADRAIARLRATGRYEFVERDRFLRTAALPNDAGFSQLWGLNNTGQFGGTPGADIRAAAAWDVIHDAPNVVVAILDSGVNINHLDLAGNIWVNPAPTFGDINGASFVNGVRTANVFDTQGHGTHVAGTVGAVGNNGGGISGVAWRVKIMPLRIMSAEGYIASSDFAAGVDYAIANGAHIMNASLFNDTHSQADFAVIAAARDAGVILVVAAGNESQNMDVTAYFPGSYPLDNIVTVGASTRYETLADFSNYGAAVDIVAPGSEILSLYFGDNVNAATLSGTSMASPHVAGALALIKARFPADTHRQLINRLLRGVDKLPPYTGKAQTGGRMNVHKAVTSTTNRPFNDDFIDRARLGGANLSIRSNNAGASIEPGEPAAATTLWWEWVAPSSGTFVLDTLGSGYDTHLAVYTGASVNNLTAIAANDNDGARLSSRLALTAQNGATYQIAVGGKSGATGLTLLHLGVQPVNDAFASAVTLTGESTQISSANHLASRENAEPSILGFPGGTSVWYRWTAPRSGQFQISARSLQFDAVLAVYTGSALDNLSLLASSDNIGPRSENTDSLCTVNAVSGTTYLISVDSKNGANTGDFTLSITDSLWQAATLRNLVGAPAVGADGTLYVGSTDFNFYAFNPDGSTKWSFPAADLFQHSTPAVGADGTVYAYCLDGKLYALNPDGSLRWARNFNVTPSLVTSATTSSPAIAADGTVYIKAGDGYLYALDPASGLNKWRFNVFAIESFASPSIAPDGTVYQGGDTALYALNANGTQKWFQAVLGGVVTSPAIDAAGNVYFGSASNGIFRSVTSAGNIRWTYNGAATGTHSSPALSADGSTVYFGARDRRLHAVNTATGGAVWTFTTGNVIGESSPAVDRNGTVYIGSTDNKLYAVHASGALKRTYDTGGSIDSSPLIFGTKLYVGSDDAKLYAFDIATGSAAGPWPQFRQNAHRLGRAISMPSMATQPSGQSGAAGASVTFSASATVPAGSPAPTYQWQLNGRNLPAATSATLTIDNIQPSNTGIYRVLVVNAAGLLESAPAILGLNSASKVIGAGTEVAADISHPNGNIFDQVLLEGSAASVRADPGQVLRISYVDLNDDIVQVEFSGAGTLSLVLDNVSGPAAPVKYNQSLIHYMRGHAGIVISGANDSTNVSVFSVGRANAVNQALFRDDVTYDGLADIAFLAVQSSDGKFAGLRTANASYFAAGGTTGIYAPGIQFDGPVFAGDIDAFDSATAVLILGATSDTRITGGNLFQSNGRAVQVNGLTQLRFVNGSTSHGVLLPAQPNQARLEQNGTDVTSQIVVNP